MNWDSPNWSTLDRLRRGFLEGTAGRRDYWQSEDDLAAYDLTFARRIGWKWDYVLADLTRLGWRPPSGAVTDWACGTGIAGRTFLRHFGDLGVSELVLSDRSRLAMDFALKEAQAACPGLCVRCDARGTVSGGTLLVSHVLDELGRAERESLLAQASAATSILWVEPGSYETSRALVAWVREVLRGSFGIVAPCTHQRVCGLLVPENERAWCHHFAPSPSEVYMDGNWGRFAKMAGIDLRSLPLSYLVLDNRPMPALPAGAVRLIGRPRIQKAHALLFVCDASGVREKRLAKRLFPAEFRQCKNKALDAFEVLEYEGSEITRMGTRDQGTGNREQGWSTACL